MQKKLTIALDQEVYKRLCILLGSDDEESCIRYIEELAQNAGANCYAPGELDAMCRAKGRQAAYHARMFSRNKAVFANSVLESQFQEWLSEQYGASDEERQLENKFLERLEIDFEAEYEDPELEAEFRKWLVNGWLWIQDDRLQRKAEQWARTLSVEIQASISGDDAR